MFWIGLGILLGAGFVLLATRSNLKLAWYDWVLLVLAVILGLLAVQNFTASMQEIEGKAATILLLMFGIPAVLLVAIVGVRAFRKRPVVTKA